MQCQFKDCKHAALFQVDYFDFGVLSCNEHLGEAQHVDGRTALSVRPAGPDESYTQVEAN